LKRKIVEIQFDIKRLYCNNKLIQTLLVFLLAKYITIRDTLDTQDNLDVNIVLQKLQEKKVLLKANKIAI